MTDPGALIFAVLMLISVIIYFAPSLIAIVRDHKSVLALLALNLLLGWTFLGWVAALVWSLTDQRT